MKVCVSSLDKGENNIITVSNNDIKSYIEKCKELAKEAERESIKSKTYRDDSESFAKACAGIEDRLEDSTLQILNTHADDIDNPHGVTCAQVGAYSEAEVDELLEKKNPCLIAGDNIVITDNEDGSQTIKSVNNIVMNYNIADNKPLINSIELSGNKDSHDLGLASLSDLPLNVSELQNDSGYLTSDDIIGKQDVITAGTGISIEDNVVSTVNCADVDLSNLTDTGRKVIDGQWISKRETLSTATAVGTYEIDLSGHLPNDNFNYELLMSIHAHNTVTDGCNISISSDIISSILISRTAKEKSTRANNTFILPVGEERKIVLTISISKLSENTLTVYAYRRIGTNSDEE